MKEISFYFKFEFTQKTSKLSFNVQLKLSITKNATTYNFLNDKGGGYHHICFLVNDKAHIDKIVTEKKIKIIWGPLPAILFDNKNIVFGYTKKGQKDIIHYLTHKILDERSKNWAFIYDHPTYDEDIRFYIETLMLEKEDREESEQTSSIEAFLQREPEEDYY